LLTHQRLCTNIEMVSLIWISSPSCSWWFLSQQFFGDLLSHWTTCITIWSTAQYLDLLWSFGFVRTLTCSSIAEYDYRPTRPQSSTSCKPTNTMDRIIQLLGDSNKEGRPGDHMSEYMLPWPELPIQSMVSTFCLILSWPSPFSWWEKIISSASELHCW